MSEIEKPRGYHQHIFAFDLETSGLFFSSNQESPVVNEHNSSQYYQIVSCGIIIADIDTLEPIETAYFEVKYNDKSIWEPKAEAVHNLSKEHLDANGISEEDFLYEFASLVIKYFGKGTIPTLGHNQVRFDIPFIQHLASRHDMYFNFGNRHIDTYGLGSICWKAFNSDDLFWKAGLPDRTTHNALEDIKLTLEAAKRTRLFFEHGLNDLLRD